MGRGGGRGEGDRGRGAQDCAGDGHLLQFGASIAPLADQAQISGPTGPSERIWNENVLLLAHAVPLDSSDHSARILEEL